MLAVIVNMVVLVDSGMRMVMGHGLAMGAGTGMVLVAGMARMFRVTGMVCFRGGVIGVMVTVVWGGH